VALLRLGRPDRVWPLLKHQPDPRVRSYLIHRLSPLGADPQALWRRFEAESEVSARRALLLCLGEFGEKELPPAEREKWLPRLLELYRNDTDPGLHGSVAWLLRQWGQRQKMEELDLASRERQRPEAGQRRWYVNGQGQTMVLIPGPVTFWMGSPRTEAGRQGEAEGRVEQRHFRRVGRSFAIAAHEVTVGQFLRFRKDHEYNKTSARSADCPINLVSWYDAAAYCNWLSKQEGIAEDQWCYLPNARGEFAAGMKVRPNFLSLTGYRLPTEAEWEYACRAETGTARYYGETDELLPNYAWYTKNSQDRELSRVGSLKPNDLGLFDMLGNDFEWCHDPVFYYPPGTPRVPKEDTSYNEDIKGISEEPSRLLRGGAFTYLPRAVRAALRDWNRPSHRYNFAGFRPARTYR
jgi:formylglycine-generating enzyme required for sulfatase activity